MVVSNAHLTTGWVLRTKFREPNLKSVRIDSTSSRVAYTSYLKDPAVLQDVHIGDRLTLRREESKFDDKAIMVLTSDGVKIGYVPEKDNAIFSRLMDAGKLLVTYITGMQKRSVDYQQISIGIYLVDF